MGFFKMINRITMFELHDWRHISFLISTGLINLLKFDFVEAKDSYYWIKIHLSYDSNKVD